ncbi:MAG: hypothetical protein A2762_06285 [Candidatus Lloydbacteria bacterium RIFCSPHIGHO2_01_FULL_54_11]|nr:MAG: hypothetical protein A2762_06285 [Candidatus Lloydbacteria bacterium RIFCSPHIGHO2_01_FULL_54_11]OGZ14214.1 MAG: hypothetical protein A2948_02675 [Candidatus Lloydbacteria bacterium RIFCSPLOWO2_01_FULL_54_18]OGZ15398.1 MAG: hypothetical protein A3H76_03520 [Candidatus Lloydbacteria bacterium RIFCSPLOWO2_02_FULL_54_12]
MTKLFIASKAQRSTWKKTCAGFLMLSLNLSIGGLGGLLLIPQVASAEPGGNGGGGGGGNSPVYTVTIDEPVVADNPLTLTGVTTATHFVGQEDDQHVVINWGDGSALTDMYLPAEAFSGDDFSWSWSASHPYANGTTQSYTIIVNICHVSCTGEEGSGDATDTTIIVIPPSDTTPPTIALHDDVSAEATSGSGAIVTYNSPATSDNVDPAGTAMCTPASGSTFVLGNTLVTCTATDVAGNSATPTTFTVTVTDNTPPAITLNGTTPDIEIGGTYTELGATAVDIIDGSFAATPSGSVNTSVVGSYVITYNATDLAGNSATPVMRTVNVIDTNDEPVLGVLGDQEVDEFETLSFNADATDADAGDTPTFSITGAPSGSSFNTATGEFSFTPGESDDGTYTVTVTVDDGNGGTDSETFDIIVNEVNSAPGNNECNDLEDNDGDGDIDGSDSGCDGFDDTAENTPPTVIIDTEMIMLTLHSIFAPPTGVHAIDVEDGSVIVDVLGNTVDVDEVGDYTVTYGATDSDSASAEPETQSVQVRAECGDGNDNDNDDRTDAEDPACHTNGDSTDEESYDPLIENESADPECDDGIDNDEDGSIDGEEDSGCSSPSDNSENEPPVIETELLALTLTAGNPLVLDYSASDDEDGDLTDDILVSGDDFDTGVPGEYEVTLNVTDSQGTAADPVIITVTVVAPPPACANSSDDDDDGLIDMDDPGCANSEDNDETEPPPPPPPTPACADETDNDQDEFVDMNDPGCSSPEDNDETDPVTPPPSGGGGGGNPPPQCANGSDDDADGLADYPNDLGCENSLDNDESGSGTPPPETPTVTGGSTPPPPPTPPAAPQGEVLGAATEEMPLPLGCVAYLDVYLKKGRKNDPEKVKLLQTFLNEEMGAGLPLTGFFGDMTHGWVKKFQVKHKKDILQPWIDAGYGGVDFGNNGTGYVYKTTKRAINMMKCAAITEPMPELVPDTQP